MQIYDMNPNEIRNLAKEYTKQGVVGRTIQCFERLLWLGELKRYEYLKLSILLFRQDNTRYQIIIDRYRKIYL